MKIVRGSAGQRGQAQRTVAPPAEKPFQVRPRQIALFFLWMLVFTLLARGTSGALLPVVQLSLPAPDRITQSITATGTVELAESNLFYAPEGLLVESVFASAGKTVEIGDKVAAFRPEEVSQQVRTRQAELAQKKTEYARLTKPVEADNYELEKAQQALQAAYQAVKDNETAWEEKETEARENRDTIQGSVSERQNRAAQYVRELAEKEAQLNLLLREEPQKHEEIESVKTQLEQLRTEETQNKEALAQTEAQLDAANEALKSIQSQKEETARADTQAAEQAEQARNDALHAYEKSAAAASETAATNVAGAAVLAEQIRELESSLNALEKLDEQQGILYATQAGVIESLNLVQGQPSVRVAGTISDPARGCRIRFALDSQDSVPAAAGITVTITQGAKSETVRIDSSVSQQDGNAVFSAVLTGSDWRVGKAELTIQLSETEYDCCLPVSALHSDNGGDFVYVVEERNTILGLQNIVRKVYVEVVERNNALAGVRNYTTGAPVVASTTKRLQEGARVRTAG